MENEGLKLSIPKNKILELWTLLKLNNAMEICSEHPQATKIV